MNINISKRIFRSKGINDIVHGIGKKREKVSCLGFTVLHVRKEMAIGRLVVGTPNVFPSVGVLLFMTEVVVCKDIGILHLV